VNADLQDALTYNTSITTAQPYGIARKTINKLHLSRLLALPMTEELYEDALTLVQQDDEEDGGATIEEGIRFLGPCDQGEYWDKEEYPQEERGAISSGQHSAKEQALVVAPNPNAGFFEVSLPQKTGGMLMAYIIQGQKIKTLLVAPGVSKVSLDLGQFPNGLYWIALSNEEGKILGTAKVSVSH